MHVQVPTHDSSLLTADHEAVCTTVRNLRLQRDGILIGGSKPLTIIDTSMYSET